MRSIKVADYMTRRLVTFHPETPLFEAMSVMLDARVSGAPIVDAEGRLMGMLSEIDFLEAMLEGSYHGDVEGTVSGVMTTGAQTLDSDSDIYSASEIFVRDGRRRLPVLENGRLVGQISRRDVLRAIKDWEDRR